MRHNTFTLAVISITCFLIIPQQTFAQEVLTKVNGGVSWQTLLTGGGIYNGSGSLSSNTAVSQGNFNLDFISTGGDLNFDQNTLLIDASNNKVGVNEATPTSTLDIHGSISLPTAHFTATTGASYTMNEDDYLLFANTSSAVAYINLPAPTTCPGRVYRFIKTRTANGIMFNRTIEVTPSTVTNHFTGTDIKLTIISDGSLWWKLEN